MAPGELGEIITFYSYKGGAGGSMALANVACLLAQKCRPKGRVLAIDWDLEAPGLHRFFDKYFRGALGHNGNEKGDSPDALLNDHPGLIELLVNLFEKVMASPPNQEEVDSKTEARLQEGIELEKYILKTDIAGLDLLKAGRLDEEYADKVNRFAWEKLHTRARWFFPWFVNWLSRGYDYVLIDSRTGTTDTSGICTAIIPEKLVLVFTPNRQSLDGVLTVVQRALEYRRRSDDLRPLLVFPLPSRIEPSMEKLRSYWRSDSEMGYQPKFEKAFERHYKIPECDLSGYFDRMQIQQVPDFAYGEEIAVLDEGARDRLSLIRSYEVFVDQLVLGTPAWEKSAGEFYSCFISHSSEDSQFASKLYGDLQASGVRCWLASQDLRVGDSIRKAVRRAINDFDKMIVVLSSNSIRSSWVGNEFEAAFARERETSNLVLCPIRLDDSVFGTDIGWAQSLVRIRHIGDFTSWQEPEPYQIALDRLLRDISAERWKPTIDPLERMITALRDGRYSWRSVERLATIGGFSSEEQALSLLRTRPEVEFGKGTTGKMIVRLTRH